MYGTGLGVIVRLPAASPWPKTDEEEDSLDERLKLYANQASSVETIGYNGDFSYLCASMDGKLVFFSGALDPDTNNYGFYLVENNGKPRELKVKLPQ